jgi:hypothetical protein
MLGLRMAGELIDEVREWDALVAGGEEGLREDMLGAICYDEYIRKSMKEPCCSECQHDVGKNYRVESARGLTSLRTNSAGVGKLVIPQKHLNPSLH